MVETFHNFQLSVTEGQRTLGRQVEAAKNAFFGDILTRVNKSTRR